ncbi:MAG: hypothetical protein WCS96_12450 [Victivallales bacterium]|jgi:hypothetical protein
MTEILIALIVIGVLTGIILLVRWLIRLPVMPDPWDKEIDRQELNDSSTPICLNCTKPVENPNRHYCPHCGNVTGEYTRYIPFVNIQFNYSIFGSLWKKLNDSKIIFPVRIIYFFLIMVLAPIMLIVGIPVRIFYMIKSKFEPKDRPNR